MINKFSNIPLYSQLKDLIVDKIERGEYPEDTKIPSEQELCETYSISRPTVRQAISELTNSGHLYKEKGKGTYVSKRKSRIDIKNYSGFTDSILESQVPGDNAIISVKTAHSNENRPLSDVFGIPYGHDVEFAEIKYLSTLKDEVLALNTSYLPLNLFPSIIEEIKEKKPSYDIMRGKYPLVPVRVRSGLEIAYTDQEDAKVLQVQIGHALLKVESVLYSKSGQIVEYIISKYRSDKCKLVFENAK